MQITVRSAALIAGITLLVMFAGNQLAARNAMARRLLKGSPVSAVKNDGAFTGGGTFTDKLIV